MQLHVARVLCVSTALFVLLTGCAPAPPGAAQDTQPTRSVVPRRSTVEAGGERSVTRALAILHRWDGRRAAAYASGEPGRLARLYVPGSLAGERDVRLLRGYAARGLAVRDLTMQVLEVEVLRSTRHRLRIRVVDRLARSTAVHRRSQVALPSGRPTTRTLTMVGGSGPWQVRSVRPVGGVSATPR